MPEPSDAYKKACADWIEEAMARPRAFLDFARTLRAPEPSSHPDERMHLTLKDMPPCR